MTVGDSPRAGAGAGIWTVVGAPIRENPIE